MSGTPAPVSQLSPASPPALDRLIGRCLAKDPDDRWQTARDLMHELRALDGAPAGASGAAAVAPPARARPAFAGMAAALVAGALLASGAWWLFAPRAGRPAAAVLELPATPGVTLSREPADLAISPDGRSIAYVASDSTGLSSLWVRPLDSPNARRIPDADRAQRPFWSPDGRWIAYFTSGEGAGLYKVPVGDGAPVRLADVSWTRGGAWGRRGDILFVPSPTSPVLRISENGGPVTPATALDTTRGETSHRHPSFLRDGEHFVFAALPPGERGWGMWLGSLRSRAVKRLGEATSAATWVEPGYLVFDRNGRCVAQRLDPARLELVGDVIPLAGSAPRTPEDATRIATGSANGRIAVLRADPPRRHLEWIGRSGAPAGVLAMPLEDVTGLRLSNDGRRAVLSRSIGRFAVQLLRVDLDRGVTTALTDAREYHAAGAWSPDDRMLALSSVRGGGREEVALIPSDGSSAPRFLATGAAQFKSPVAWSPDGSSLVVSQVMAESNRDLFLVDAARGGAPRPLVTDPGSQPDAAISPDGRWFAYSSDETGREQVYVRRFPDGDGKLQVSVSGGSEPHWVNGGREIVFLGPDRRSFRALTFEPGREPDPGAARLLFRSPSEVDRFGWDVTKDGGRFLLLAPDAAVRPPTATIVVDWPALVERR